MAANWTDKQREAIYASDRSILVAAAAGSGKTAVLVERILRKITDETHPADIDRLVVVTFTKAAAREMKDRFERLCEEAGLKADYRRVTFGTFHGVFYGILRHAYHLTGKNILSEERKYEMLKEIAYGKHLEIEDEKDFFQGLSQEISQVKNTRIPLEHYYSANCPDEIFRSIYIAYVNRCRHARLLDFDDMLLYCYDLLDQREDIRRGWQGKFQYILVDEFQDINKLQYDIVKMLAAPQNNLFIVGDDDQSIYAFRGARPEIMLGFEKDYVDGVKEGWKTRKKCKRAVDNPEMRKHCLSIEGELIAGTFIYVWEFFNRKVLGR